MSKKPASSMSCIKYTNRITEIIKLKLKGPNLSELPFPSGSSLLWLIPQSSKMNDADVSKQIQQMVRFIRQEAEEKANEILVSAEEVLLSSSSLFLFCWIA